MVNRGCEKRFMIACGPQGIRKVDEVSTGEPLADETEASPQVTPRGRHHLHQVARQRRSAGDAYVTPPVITWSR